MPLVVPAKLLTAGHSYRGGGAFNRMEQLCQRIRRGRGVVVQKPDPLHGITLRVTVGGGELLQASANSRSETGPRMLERGDAVLAEASRSKSSDVSVEPVSMPMAASAERVWSDNAANVLGR